MPTSNRQSIHVAYERTPKPTTVGEAKNYEKLGSTSMGRRGKLPRGLHSRAAFPLSLRESLSIDSQRKTPQQCRGAAGRIR
jgi:hypothetical protein